MMAIAHGWPKFQSFSEKSETFLDPLGIGNKLSLIATIGCELGLSILLIIGFATRFAAAGLVFTMGVIAFVFHGGDGWLKQELPVLYLLVYGTIVLTGPGDFSIDRCFKRKPKVDE